MRRLAWLTLGTATFALGSTLAGGCATNNSDSFGGGGAASTSTHATSATGPGATTSTSASTTSTTTTSTTSATTTTSAATTSSTGNATSSSTGGGVPPTWTCDPDYYGDTDCDCGCGAHDIDCATALVDECAYCGDTGSCSPADCPGSIDPTNNAQCVTMMAETTAALCADNIDNDFDGDLDCDDSDCVGMPGCPPAAWTCPASAYTDVLCDCGCGVVDPACANATIGVCDYCDDVGSCSENVFDCPGLIDPANNAVCAPASPENTDVACADGADNDQDGDADCADVDCLGHASCAPLTWTCDPAYYADADCDCGCGAHDPACANALVGSCDYCADLGSCSATDCPGTINPTNNAICP